MKRFSAKSNLKGSNMGNLGLIDVSMFFSDLFVYPSGLFVYSGPTLLNINTHLAYIYFFFFLCNCLTKYCHFVSNVYLTPCSIGFIEPVKDY